MTTSFSSMPIVYEKNAFSMPFLSGYKLLKIPIVNRDGEPAWPELFPIDRIEILRETVGPNATDNELRWSESQRALVRQIETLVSRGKGDGA